MGYTESEAADPVVLVYVSLSLRGIMDHVRTGENRTIPNLVDILFGGINLLSDLIEVENIAPRRSERSLVYDYQ